MLVPAACAGLEGCSSLGSRGSLFPKPFKQLPAGKGKKGCRRAAAEPRDHGRDLFSFPRYWKLDPGKVYSSNPNMWDTAVHDASEEYKHRMVRLRCPRPAWSDTSPGLGSFLQDWDL